MNKIMLLLLCLMLFVPGVQAADQTAAPPPLAAQNVPSPGVDLWNEIRGRDGTDTGQIRTQVQGVDTGVLINKQGQDWREYRMEKLIPNAAIVLGLVALAIIVFRLVRGKIPIRAGRSDHKIKRFSTLQRYVHWTTAILFVALAITGMVLMFGRHIVIPVFGAEIGGTLTYLFKRIHDFAGPAFAVSLVVLVITFMKGNMPKLLDLKWLAKGGGLFGDKHVSAECYNAGEKGWYWIAAIVGAFVVVSGLVLDFPNFEQGRNVMTWYHWIHSIAGVVIMSGAMGHIYMGTVAMEGAFEAMATGYCDANWAKEHHDLWYEEMKDQAVPADSIEQAKGDGLLDHSR
ncbi:formate dehydrogenase subunit gamma [Thiothrix lacustris]|uniref:Formate dehydrogenase subunit gamma n=1 Tax=Thiothrix lacustris TaxID=525917 RepID=A0ABY9MU33_9GAMM|nr:formate dehydrogenase subunit gamma [Thiothrix lacustris]WML92171.1 formate dehydrogenase subunit gamma [Thiothrix lacustris]